MKLSLILERFNEALGGPDDSGIRARGVPRKPDRRLPDFPYDRDMSYGQPAGNDRGTSSAGSSHHPITPKDTEHFSLSILDLEEIIKEFTGAPMQASKGDTSNQGSAIPGMGGSWSNRPKKPWDKAKEITDHPVKDPDVTYDNVSERSFNPQIPEVEPIPHSNFTPMRSQTDDDLENRLNGIWGREDNMNFVQSKDFGQPDFHMVGGDPWSVINQHLSSRGLYGMLPKESAWDRVSGMANRKKR